MGQGPDELFGGYRRHLFAKYGYRAQWLSSSAPLRWVVRHAFDKVSASRLLSSLDATGDMQGYESIFSQLPGAEVDGLFQNGILETGGAHRVLECWTDLAPIFPQGDRLAGLQFLELRSSLPDELLLYADKISMAHGLEIRVPYLDHEIVEYVERLSSSYKVRNGSRKWLHRKVCKRFLPKAAVAGPKVGFETPSGHWLQTDMKGSSGEYLQDPESLIYEFLRFEEVNTMLDEHRTGQAENPDFLFSLIALEVWLRESGQHTTYSPEFTSPVAG
jgi:asparagine synthase (glutamine-hydrolysing)